jgi:hypothetical protein
MRLNVWTGQSLPVPRVWMRLIGWWQPGWLVPSLLACLLAGCLSDKPKVVVIPADRLITWAPKGSTNSIDGYLVPPARMQEILHALEGRTNSLNY